MFSIRALSKQLADGEGGRALLTLARSIRAPDVMAAGALVLVYVALEWMSFIHEHKGVPVTPWNPGLGVAFGMIVLKGTAYGLVLFIGVLVAEIFVLHTGLAWPVILAIAAVVAASYTGAAVLARDYLRLDVGLRHVRDVLVLLAAGVVGAAVVAVLLALLLLITNELDISDLPKSALPLFVGDVIGIAVVTPLLLRLAGRWRELSHTVSKPLILEIVLFIAATGFALWMIVGSDRSNDYKYVSLLFLPVVAVAVRHGMDGSCLALAATQLGLVALLKTYGYDAAAFTEFQIVMFVLTMTGLLVGVVVSERREADLAARLAEARLKESRQEAARAARLNMVSGMASALAHEINQPMTAARALARSAQQILRSPSADIERVSTNLSALVVQIDHAGGVVRRMREFLRRGQPHFSTLNVHTILDDALVLARPEAATHHTRIDLEIAEPLPSIFGDRIQLQQVVLNLVRNAMDAIAETRRSDGHIHVRAHLADQGTAVEISVIDNGAGVPAEDTLFAPLSSSKTDGIGLGLSICANIVHAHGGRIWLQSSQNGTTEFRFSLPLQAGT
ncbi:MAG: MASE1 domain-containing protein [Hyphomonadaceae bacterium]|jgi:signal transduction histidine kinase|nr:MASE1 domain-containing protein [Hyphomonadaceae bacterium]